MIDRIYIPTYKRHDNQVTWNNLPKEYQKKVVMVVQKQEMDLYDYDCDFLPVDNEIGIAKTREIISHYAGTERYSVLDDDITFIRRNEKYFERVRIDTRTKNEYPPYGEQADWKQYGKWIETNDSNMSGANRIMNKKDFDDMYTIFHSWMDDGIFHCGHRRAQYPPAYRYRDNAFFNSAHHIDGKVLSEFIDDIDWTYCEVGEDAHFMLEYLTRGYCNRRSDEFGFQADNYQEGGCSVFRDAKYHNREHEKLRKKFPDFVISKERMAQGKHGKNIGMINEFSYKTLKAFSYGKKQKLINGD